MIMENKYFVPEISDLRVGYECEIYEQSTNKLIKKIDWHPVKVIIGNSKYGKSIAINRIPNYLKQDKIRVSYLTKEQIESEGWKFNGTGFIGVDNKEIEVYNKKNCELRKYKNEFITIAQFIENQLIDILYKGTCKSINELRRIQKLLEI